MLCGLEKVEPMSVKYIPGPAPMEGEMSLKQWCTEEALRTGKTPHAVYNRLYRKRYHGLTIRRVNKRVVFVKI